MVNIRKDFFSLCTSSTIFNFVYSFFNLIYVDMPL